ncbi:MAG: TIGR01212 family radical SAM protein [Tissierellia bacterium]|nr:TIGR01212 family radical SAM protein [Tissierellia bacterium]
MQLKQKQIVQKTLNRKVTTNGVKRYLSLQQYGKIKYGKRVVKLPIDLGATCPNRDGTIGTKGCIFCTDRGSGEWTVPELTISEQLKYQTWKAKKKWGEDIAPLAYAQNFSNTYMPLEELMWKCKEMLDGGVSGISLATRIDCLDKDNVEFLKHLSLKYIVWLELGLQSIHNSSLQWMNRGYSQEYFQTKWRELELNELEVIGHIIFGLPGESKEEMLKTVDYISEAGFSGVKFHQLYIVENSPLAKEHEKNNLRMLEKEEYVELVGEALARLDSRIAVHRLTGDGDRESLIAPLWGKDKAKVLTEIDRYLKINSITQGCKRKGMCNDSIR